MPGISRESILSLESYSRQRSEIRARTIAHKKNRTIHLGDHLTLIFEDDITIRYQIQEMLRAERIFEEEGIQGELDAYNPLVPDGSNFKATVMIEYEDVSERQRQLSLLKGIEDRLWLKVGTFDRVWGIADEDMDRANDEKTSAVHFVRFELTKEWVDALKQGAPLAIGVDHPEYHASMEPVAADARDSLMKDLI
ncbi:MAG: DUF3501 family protein [Burkholderiales bacterium]